MTLISVMVVGAWQIVQAALPTEELDFPRTWLDFRQGHTTGKLEKQLDKNLPARPLLIGVANSLRYTITGGAGDQVRTGRENWLFLTDEIRFYAQGEAHLRQRVSLLAQADRGLAAQGVKLVIALVPDKARVYEGKLVNAQYPEFNRSRYPQAMSALRSQGLTVVDLLPLLRHGAANADVYYRTDTHWNQLGAHIAAKAVADAVRALGLNLETTHFTTQGSSAPVERPGDLIRLMGLENMPNALRPRPDSEATVTTLEGSSENSGGLFDDAVVPVALVGTSYSLRGNFHGYLQQSLSAKVLNTAKDGGGFLQAASAYLKDESFNSSKPKVLVWEIPERLLYAPPEGEDQWLASVGLN